jgi:MFS family permease
LWRILSWSSGRRGSGRLTEVQPPPDPSPLSGLPGDAASVAGGGEQARRGWLTRNLKVVSGISFLQDTASELLYPILPILLTTVLGAPAAAVGIVEGIAEGIASLAKVSAGRLADRVSRRPLIGLGYGLAVVGKAVIAVAAAWPVVLVGRALDRLGKGIRGVPRDALVAADVAPAARGRAFGFHRSADTAGAVVGPLLSLGAYELLDHQIRPLLWIALIPAVLSTLLVTALREPPRPAPPPPRTRWQPRRLPGRYWRVVIVLTAFSLVNFPDALLLLRLAEIGFSVPAVIGVAPTSEPERTISSVLPGQ